MSPGWPSRSALLSDASSLLWVKGGPANHVDGAAGLPQQPDSLANGGRAGFVVHIVDLYTTLARVGGAEVPNRAIDGVDQLDFFLGKQETSNREGFPAYVADRLSAVKWRNWKAHLIWQENMYAVPQKLPLPKVINLLTDLKEERDVGPYNTWVAEPIFRIIGEFEASPKKYPPIKIGTPDPYTPPP